jgi:multidrug resistance efflux pump
MLLYLRSATRLAAVAIALATVGCERGQIADVSIEASPQAADVARGPIRLTGSVEAVRSRAVMAPRLSGQNLNSLVITRLVSPGTRVEAGDVLVEFDPQDQQRLAFDKQAEVVDLDSQIDKKRSDQAAAQAKDQTELLQAEHDVERAKLDVRKNDLVARVEAEKNSLALEQATARLAQLRETFALKREAEAADLEILKIRRARAEQARLYAQSNVERMQVLAPFAGLAVIKTTFRNTGMSEILEGDEVRPGLPIVDIVDTSAMQVRAKVNQADVGLVRTGLPAKIRLDGFPSLLFDGEVVMISPLGVASDMSAKVRSFVAVVSIHGTAPQLMPDLTASVEILPDAAPPDPPAGRSGGGA